MAARVAAGPLITWCDCVLVHAGGCPNGVPGGLPPAGAGAQEGAGDGAV